MKTSTIFRLLLAPLLLLTACKKDADVTPSGPSGPDLRVDTKPLDYYIKIAETLSAKQEPPQADWDALLGTYIYDLLIKRGISTAQEQQDYMRGTYKVPEILTPEQRAFLAYQFEYKSNLPQLKAYSASLNDGSLRIGQAVKQHLYPMLPPRLQQESLIPPITYSYFGQGQANGFADIVIQDALLAYKIDSYARGKGTLTAHEAFHSVTGVALQKRLKLQLPDTDARVILKDALRGISGEGLADLIDKEILGSPDSPVASLVPRYDDENLSKNYIRALNAELERLSTQEVISNATQFRETVLTDAGHQPGKYMGKAIKQANLLGEIVPDVENPFQFFYSYNKAATQLSGDYPVFSTTAINYLKRVESQLINPRP
ncbi:hypothetical protein IC235_05075 [Hymenobacter sp. BT664]|uniref:DUF885 domain-containing protein n=1 Tax=Hymenobacter montanus TaxID=2771359 RepID=A0A927GIA8_9BACT|nr:DUF5700 domain-containing putative Zn-dependent protease [Hymenobacter montanus]MBD2767258.1 hypothetical protein [Hymenobacter montanus]